MDIEGLFLQLLCCSAVILPIVLLVRRRSSSKKEKPPSPLEKPTSEKEITGTFWEHPFADKLDNSTVYTIMVPKTTKWNAEQGINLITHLPAVIDFPVLFRIEATIDGVVWKFIDIESKWQPSHVANAVSAIYPEAEVGAKEYMPQPFKPSDRMTLPFIMHPPGQPFRPIRSVDTIKNATIDPLNSFVRAVSGLQEGERFVYSLLVHSVVDDDEKKWIRGKTRRSTGLDALVILTTDERPKGTGSSGRGKYDEATQRTFDQKVDDYLFSVFCVMQLDLPVDTPVERRSTFLNAMTVLAEQTSTDYGLLGPSEDVNIDDHYLQIDDEELGWTTSSMAYLGRDVQSAIEQRGVLKGKFSRKYKKHRRVILSPPEIATLWHLPYEGFTSPDIVWTLATKADDEILENTKGVIMGDNTIHGERYPVRIHPHDRETHMYIVGRTGVGKSTFMHNLIHQDIAAGEGVCVVDPHGKLVSDILRLSIPEERKHDVVVLDVTNQDYPAPLNPLSGTTPGDVVAILETLEPSGIPPRIYASLIAAFETLKYEDKATVRDVVRLFSDTKYRYDLINRVEDVPTQEFWDTFEMQSPGRQDELAFPVLHRMRRFYGNTVLHPILCHPKPVNIEHLIKERKIILMSLGIDTRLVPEELQSLLGVVLVKQIQMATMSSFRDTAPFYLYIDEVQNFITAPLNKIFEEARKFGLYLTVANQYLRQLGSVVDAVMGTVGATVAFQVGSKDSRTLATYFAPQFAKEDLEQIDKYQAAVRMRFLGNTKPAFMIETRPEPTDLIAQLDGSAVAGREAKLRALSIQNYTPMHKDKVMGWLNERYPRRQYTAPTVAEDDVGDDGWFVDGNDKQ